MMLRCPVIILSTQEAYDAVRNNKFVTAKGKRPIGIGQLDKDRSVLLFRTPDENSVRRMYDGVIFYTSFTEADADPDL